MHQSVIDWAERMVSREGIASDSVLDVGSNSSNGSLRHLFTGQYVGVDLDDGPGVDRFPRDIEEGPIYLGHTINGIVCTEVLEHVIRPWEALSNLRDSLGKGDWMLLTCRGYDERGCWPVHEHPIDVWRFSALSLHTMADEAGWSWFEIETDPEGPGWLCLGHA